MSRPYLLNVTQDACGIREGFCLPCFSSGVKGRGLTMVFMSNLPIGADPQRVSRPVFPAAAACESVAGRISLFLSSGPSAAQANRNRGEDGYDP